MNKECEDYLWNGFGYSDEDKPSPREVIEKMIELSMINNAKQAHRTLEKWIGKGIYEYGCCMDLGWKIPHRNI